MLIREFRPSDRDAVLALAPRLTEGVAPWRDPDAVGRAVRQWVEGSIRSGTVFVADDDGRVAGFVSASTREHWSGAVDAYIGELVVDPAAEGRGVGRALVAAVEAWAVESGLRLLTLETGAANASARAFYRRLGFAEEDVRLTRRLR
jgi:ribosomal protein S18 acetylase RimI-like enzyme